MILGLKITWMKTERNEILESHCGEDVELVVVGCDAA
jgi:hypothetical protein